MTNKLKKIAAMLLAGVLACTALVGCYNYNSSGGSNFGNTQQSSQYVGLSPTEIGAALSNADSFVITSHATMKNDAHGFSQTASLSTQVAGNLVKTSGTIMVEKDIIEYNLYADMNQHTVYYKEDGNWTSDTDDSITPDRREEFVGLLAFSHDAENPFKYITDSSNYNQISDTRYEMHGNTLKGKLMDGSGTSSGYMTSSGSTYTFVMTAQRENTVLNFTVTIEFKSTSVTIPDSVRG